MPCSSGVLAIAVSFGVYFAGAGLLLAWDACRAAWKRRKRRREWERKVKG